MFASARSLRGYTRTHKGIRDRMGGTVVTRVCVFDVNETLLDMGALDPHFERVFGDASASIFRAAPPTVPNS